jgi:hypothetical protein
MIIGVTVRIAYVWVRSRRGQCLLLPPGLAQCGHKPALADTPPISACDAIHSSVNTSCTSGWPLRILNPAKISGAEWRRKLSPAGKPHFRDDYSRNTAAIWGLLLADDDDNRCT